MINTNISNTNKCLINIEVDKPVKAPKTLNLIVSFNHSTIILM